MMVFLVWYKEMLYICVLCLFVCFFPYLHLLWLVQSVCMLVALLVELLKKLWNFCKRWSLAQLKKLALESRNFWKDSLSFWRLIWCKIIHFTTYPYKHTTDWIKGKYFYTVSMFSRKYPKRFWINNEMFFWIQRPNGFSVMSDECSLELI